MLTKVCGLRDPQNLADLATLPIDWFGFIFYPKSPRYVSPQQLAPWLESGSASWAQQQRVGVFVNAEVEELMNTVHDCKLNYVQLHGEERPDYCQELQLLWTVSSIRRAGIIKAFRVDERFDFAATADYAPFCDYFLFDTRGEQPGGTGQQFDWSILAAYTGHTPFLLSGGIGPGDADRLRAFQHPALAGIDLNSRFETAPGLKDVAAINQFLQQFTQV